MTIVDTVDLGQQELLNVRVCLDKVFDSHSEAEPEEVELQLMWLHVCLGCECDCICVEEELQDLGHLVLEGIVANSS